MSGTHRDTGTFTRRSQTAASLTISLRTEGGSSNEFLPSYHQCACIVNLYKDFPVSHEKNPMIPPPTFPLILLSAFATFTLLRVVTSDTRASFYKIAPSSNLIGHICLLCLMAVAFTFTFITKRQPLHSLLTTIILNNEHHGHLNPLDHLLLPL